RGVAFECSPVHALGFERFAEKVAEVVVQLAPDCPALPHDAVAAAVTLACIGGARSHGFAVAELRQLRPLVELQRTPSAGRADKQPAPPAEPARHGHKLDAASLRCALYAVVQRERARVGPEFRPI